jgi:molybdate transport system regulatory protein
MGRPRRHGECNPALDVLQCRAVEPKLRVWVVFGKRLKFGDGRARLLELIDAHGSLRRAAAELGMSYRNAWGYLRELERGAGFKLVARAPEGTSRSGMHLTARGRDFVARYRRFQRGLDGVAARRFARAFRERPLGARRGR